MTLSVTFHALYSDGGTYRVMYDASERKTYLATTDGGFMDVPFHLNGASFVRYDFHYVPQPRLRACDVCENIDRLNASLALLTPPQKPADAPIPIQQPEDYRLHVEAGGDSFRALQTAGAKAEMEYRANRQRARQQAMQEMNEPDVQKIQAARQYAAEVLAARKPRGKGAAFVIKNGNGE
jgi:hypothetical protein